MNFRIIENPDPGYNIKDVITDYQNHDIPVKKIREKYGISKGSWVTLLKHLREDGVPMRSNHRMNRTPKYYVHDKRYGIWYVQRTIKSRVYRFGGYKSEEEAKEKVQELHNNGWNGLL